MIGDECVGREESVFHFGMLSSSFLLLLDLSYVSSYLGFSVTCLGAWHVWWRETARNKEDAGEKGDARRHNNNR